MAIQKLLIQYFLNPLARIMARLPQKLKDTGFIVFFLWIILLYMGRGSELLEFRYFIFFALGCVGLGGMILCSLPTCIKPVTFRKGLILPWFGIGGLMLSSGIFFNIDYLPEALLFLAAYPVIFIIWNQSDSTKVFKQLLKGIELSFWLYVVICILFYPMQAVRYHGLFSNINGTAGYLALVAVCLLVDCLSFQKITIGCFRKVVAFGLCAALLLYTGSRTGIVELAAVLIVAVILGLVRVWKQHKLLFFRNIFLIALSTVLFFNITITIMQFAYTTKTDIVLFLQSFFAEEPHDVPTNTTPDSSTPTPPDSSAPTPPDSSAPTTPSKPTIRPGDSAGLIGDRLNTSGQTMDQFSTGRLQIWKGYLKELNLWGHADSGSIHITFNGTPKTYHTTHMTILQISYENGLIAGMLYLIFNLTAGVYALLYALKHRDDPYAILPLLISVAYGVYSLLANTGISFWYLATLMYYLVQTPIMAKPCKALEPKETPNCNI